MKGNSIIAFFCIILCTIVLIWPDIVRRTGSWFCQGRPFAIHYDFDENTPTIIIRIIFALLLAVFLVVLYLSITTLER